MRQFFHKAVSSLERQSGRKFEPDGSIPLFRGDVVRLFLQHFLAHVFRHLVTDTKQFKLFDDVGDQRLPNVSDHLSGYQQSCQLLEQVMSASVTHSISKLLSVIDLHHLQKMHESSSALF